MTEPINGSERGGIVALGHKLVGSLPPVFVMLLAINAGFIGATLWFLDAQMQQRTALADKLIDHCMGAMTDVSALQARVDSLEHDVRQLEAERSKGR